MKRITTYARRLARPAGFTLALLTVCLYAVAQDRDKYDTLAAKYKDYPAVYTNITEQLVISEEDGALNATSNVTMEKLFISDLSLNHYNTDFFYFGDFYDLSFLHGVAFVPAKGKTYRQMASALFGAGRPYDYVFYDDRRLVETYYTGLKKNSITRTHYSLTFPDVRMLNECMFQDTYHGLPVASVTYEIITPEYVKMKFVMKGENTSRIKQTTEEKNGKIYYRFTATDMPAFKGFADVPSSRYYVPHVLPYISSFRLHGAKKDSIISENTDELYKYMYYQVQLRNIKIDTFISNTVDKIVKKGMTPREKAAAIYKWVQDNIHYVAIENGMEGFVPRPADTVFKRKYGDCKDMASMTQAMCSRAGLDAHFCWIGTNRLPYDHSDIPLNWLSNHMICALKLDDQWIFIDGTHNTLPFGCNRYDIQGKEALIAVDANKYEIVKIPVEPADRNSSVDSTYITLTGKKIAGHISQVYKGYPAWELALQMLYYKKEDDREKFIRELTERGSHNYNQGKYDVQISPSGNRDMSVSADFDVDNYITTAGKLCYVNMNLQHYYLDERIDTEDRKVSSYNKYLRTRKEVVVLDIPKGYKVKYLPAAEKRTVEGVGSYSVSYVADKNRITLTKVYEINAMSVPAGKFADNNKMVDDLRKLYKESVVLTSN